MFNENCKSLKVINFQIKIKKSRYILSPPTSWVNGDVGLKCDVCAYTWSSCLHGGRHTDIADTWTTFSGVCAFVPNHVADLEIVFHLTPVCVLVCQVSASLHPNDQLYSSRWHALADSCMDKSEGLG